MHNIISSELIKMRKNYTLLFSALFVFTGSIFLLTVPDTPPYLYFTNWVMENTLFTSCIILPIMSGFVITMLMQREYQDQTIINVLVSPVARNKFVVSKLIIWFMWYLITVLVIIAIYIMGSYFIYQDQLNLSDIMHLAGSLSMCSMLNFIASLPLLWITIKQRKMFYPSLIAVLFFGTIQVLSTQVTESTMLLLSITPWSAVTLNVIKVPAPYSIITLISISIAGIAGVTLSFFSFNRQDQ